MLFFEDVSEVRAALHLEHTEDDGLLAEMLAEAEAEFRKFIRPNVVTSASAVELYDGGVSKMHLRRWPLAVNDSGVATVAVRDLLLNPDEDIDPTLYQVKPRLGQLVAVDITAGLRRFWPAGIDRFQVTYTAGLDADPEWADVGKLGVRRSLVDLVVEWYENRNPRQGMGATPSVMPSQPPDAGALNVPNFVPPRIAGSWIQYRDIV